MMNQRPLFALAALCAGLLVGCGPTLPSALAAPSEAGFHTAGAFGRATTKKGVTVDPINLLFIGTRWEVTSAFAGAGWLGADDLSLRHVARQGEALLGKSYQTAPFSNLYYFNRAQDLGYEKNATNIKQRDHLRLWMSNMLAVDGRPVWVCAASRDIGIGVSRNSPTLITHKVEPNHDLERDMVVADIENAGRIQQTYWLPGVPIDETKPFAVKSDGRVALIVLKPTFSLFGW
jgi:hypothetical protein